MDVRECGERRYLENPYLCVLLNNSTLRLAYIENGLLRQNAPPHPWSVFTEQAATVGGLSHLSSNTLPVSPTHPPRWACCYKQESHFSTSTISIDNLIFYAFVPSWLCAASTMAFKAMCGAQKKNRIGFLGLSKTVSETGLDLYFHISL